MVELIDATRYEIGKDDNRRRLEANTPKIGEGKAGMETDGFQII